MERICTDIDQPATGGGNAVERLTLLFDAHYDRLYRLARRLASGADDALDLVQETFLRAARSPNSVPCGTRDGEAWLVRVLIDIRRDQWRKTASESRALKALLQAGRSAISGREAEAAVLNRAAVWQGLDLLAPRRRAILVLHELEGIGIPALASLLGISAITVRWHLSMGRRELALRLNAHVGRKA